MIIGIEDIKIGDEILVPCQVDFKRLKVERLPSKNKDGGWKKVKCAVRNDSIGSPGYWATYNCLSDDYNDSIYMDLHYRRIWLIKRI